MKNAVVGRYDRDVMLLLCEKRTLNSFGNTPLLSIDRGQL